MSSKKKGLPKIVKMRHNMHFIDELSSRIVSPLSRMIAISKIEPNPQQPRSSPGDLTELKASIEQKGILEPILVRFIDDKYQIISGERRYTAAKELGMKEVSCIVMKASDVESLEISLIENLQRKDLSPFEEAEGLRALCQRFNYTHEEIATKIGKSRATITEILSLTNIPPHIRQLCHSSSITAKSMLLQVARQKDEEHMIKLINSISRRGLTRAEARNIRFFKTSRLRQKNYIFKFSPKDRSFSLQIKYRKPHINKDDIIQSLDLTIEYLKDSENN